MKREKFLQDAKANPSRFYRNPADILRDRRLSHEDRLEILGAWERAAWNDNELMREELRRLREQLESAMDGALPAHQPHRA